MSTSPGLPKALLSLHSNRTIIRCACTNPTPLPEGEFRSASVWRKIEVSMKHPSKPTLVVAGILLLVAILLPQVVSAGWHLVHGRTVNYRAWKIAVPFGWYAMKRDDGMTVERMSGLPCPWRKGPVAMFQPVHFTKTFPFSYDIFEKYNRSTLKAWDYSFVEQHDVKVAGDDGRCLTFDHPKNRDQVWISCVVPKELTSADYIGSKAYADEFLSLLTQTQRNPTASN